ncbi:MAG: tetratricopeptide repeat protein [Fibrobacterota bacterium]
MKRSTLVGILFLTTGLILPKTATAELSPEEIRERLEEIRREKEEAQESDAGRRGRRSEEESRASRAETIRRYEQTLDDCDNATGFQKTMCAEAYFSLGRLYYDRARDEFVQAQNEYEERFAEWQENPVGDRPSSPRPDYTLALRTYQEAIETYPESDHVPNAYFQIGGIYNLRGEVDSSLMAFESIIEERPHHRLVNNAHFRIAEIHFNEFRHRDALQHLEKIDMSQLSAINREMAHYRIAESYYNIGDLDRAARQSGEYIDNVDRGIFPRGDLRNDAMEYMALAFSDMPDGGAEKALDYFDKNPNRTYEDTVIYEVGFNNFDHGQYEQAILALGTAVERFPNFKDAPLAQMRIVNAHIINKRYEDANAAREELINTYDKDSEWVRNNQDNSVALAEAEEHVQDAIASTAVYYHTEAQKDTADADEVTAEAREKYRNALDMYIKFIDNYPDELWRNYQYRFYAGDIYYVLGQYQKAADYYDAVAQADLSEYPEYSAEMGDTTGMSSEMIEELRREQEENMMDITQEEAGYNAIASLDKMRENEAEEQGLEDEEAYNLASTQEFLNYAIRYQSRFPDADNAPDVLLLAASTQYDGKDYSAAIENSQILLETYEDHEDEELLWDARRLLADAYSANKEFDLAVRNYNILLEEEEDNDKVINLASGTLFNKAQHLKSTGEHQQAADVFRSIKDKYPASEYKEEAWFEAGLAFEEMNAYDSAAITFAEIPELFPEAELKLRRNAYGRAGDNYAEQEDYISAAEISYTAAENIEDTADVLGFYSTSADYYDSAGAPERGGEAMVQIYENFPLNEKTPAALYRAGDFFENKAENYQRAIAVYTILAEEYPESQEGLDGAYSIGFCYDKMDDTRGKAEAFAEFAKNFTRNRPNQIQALVFATRAYLELGEDELAETNVRLATRIYDEYKEDAAIAPEIGAEAYYTLAQLHHEKILEYDLSTGSSEKEVEEKIDEVRELIEPTVEAYTISAEQKIREWVVKSLFQLARLNYDYARMYEERKVFGNEEDQIVAKAEALKGVCPGLYDRAVENLTRLIQRAAEQDIRNEYIEDAKELVVESGYRKATLLKKVGILYRDAPMPEGLSPEEEQYYMDELYNQYLNYYAQTVPYYEEALQTAIDLRIGHNEWVDSIQKEIELVEIETMEQVTSEYKSIDLDEKLEEYEQSEEAHQERVAAVERKTNEELEQSLATITRIYNSEMPIDEKISQLHTLEEEAREVIKEEEEKIQEYRDILGVGQNEQLDTNNQ